MRTYVNTPGGREGESESAAINYVYARGLKEGSRFRVHKNRKGVLRVYVKERIAELLPYYVTLSRT